MTLPDELRHAADAARLDHQPVGIYVDLCNRAADRIQELERESLVIHLNKQIPWSGETFGTGYRLMAVIKHIRKELDELETEPFDVFEWIDVILLGLDGAWRSGRSAEEIMSALSEKLAINMERKWPEIGNGDEVMEHVKIGVEDAKRAEVK